MLLSPLLAGCQRVERLYDSRLTADTPLDWWHQLEGGVIAEERPPPPGVGAPYPNLSQVPSQKPTVNTAKQQALAAQLLAERDRVRREVVQDPLPVPPPARPAAPPVATTDPQASHIVADAASAPPAAPAPAVPGPAVAAPAPLPAAPPAPAAAPSRAASVPTPRDAAAAPASPVQPAELPTIPEAPPALPQFAGVKASLLPAPSRPGPPGVEVGFGRGSAALPRGAEDALRALAARRAGGPIVVRAGGDAGPAPVAQAAALPLALRRADAVRAALVAAGVPAGDVHAIALAAARGTRADLIQSP